MRTDRVADLPDGPKTTEEQEDWILGPVRDYIENDHADGDEGWGRVRRYLEHVGIDVSKADARSTVEDAVLGHYRLPDGSYDVDRMINDTFSQPAIQELLAEEEAKLEHRRMQKAQSKRRRREAKRATAGSQS